MDYLRFNPERHMMTTIEYTANWLSNFSIYTIFTCTAALLAIFWTGETKGAEARKAAKIVMVVSGIFSLALFATGLAMIKYQ
ncbi:hypothetical protein G6M17_07385 [Agrobacterium tumefaciens]|nr:MULTISPECIES: hypothetical protein [Rhizobium/Agrobacterium group]MCZ7442986.1 hypothetical protein [Rhizobium rhizogenes]NSZ78973.1 hypothetical protein [Agrobacterium tumefaciens]